MPRNKNSKRQLTVRNLIKVSNHNKWYSYKFPYTKQYTFSTSNYATVRPGKLLLYVTGNHNIEQNTLICSQHIMHRHYTKVLRLIA